MRPTTSSPTSSRCEGVSRGRSSRSASAQVQRRSSAVRTVPHSRRTIAQRAAPAAKAVSARSTIAGAYSASWGTSSASSAARASGRARLAQPLEQPAAAPRRLVSAHGLFPRTGVAGGWRRAVQASCDGYDWCDAEVRTPELRKSSNSAAYSGPGATGGANLSATGCDARFAPVAARKARDSAAFGGSSANSVRRVRRVDG